MAGPEPLSQNDWRNASVALLMGRDGEAFGGVTVVSSDLAVTTADVASSAAAKFPGPARGPSDSLGPLLLIFPQFAPSPGVYPLSVSVQAIDKDRGFGVLKFSGALPLSVSSSLLGTGEVPEEGSECDVLYHVAKPDGIFSIRGQVGGASGMRFRLDVGEAAPGAIVGGSVFSGNHLVGIVASPPQRAFDPNAFGPGFDTAPFVEVLSVAAMAQSRVTPAIRGLLPVIDGDAQRSSSTGTEIVQQQASVGDAANAGMSVGVPTDPAVEMPDSDSPPATADLADSSLFARLSPSSRHVLARANGIRVALEKNRVHTEYLIAALFPAWQRFFERAGISDEDFRGMVRQELRTDLPPIYRVPNIEKLPPVSANVKQALVQASAYADKRRAHAIWTMDLLYGVLSVEESITKRMLNRESVRREDIRPEDGPEGEGVEIEFTGLTNSNRGPGERASGLLVRGANPTPKVDSDLWSYEDRLGYETYARTIASLITHKETKPPLTIGIKAPWGAGKTTLMKRVQRLLDGDADSTQRSDSGLKQMWQESTLTFWSLLATLNRKTIIVDPEKHDPVEDLGPGKARELLRDAVRVDALKPKESAGGRGYGISPRITVWFNAWKYQTSEQIWAGMAYCMISQITARMDTKQRELFWLRLRMRRINADEVRWRIWSAIFRQLLPFSFLVATICALVFGVLSLFQVFFPLLVTFPHLFVYLERSVPFAGILAIAWRTGAKLSEKAAGAVRDLVREPGYEDKMGYLAIVEGDIHDVLRLASVTSKQPLVVFVDDLDRCAPNKVAEVVEAINLFLCGDYPNCIFVLGMEPGMVAAALEVANKDVIEKAKELGLVDRTVPVGWRFMEKIVQLPIMIPAPTEEGRREYVDSLTGLSVGGGAWALKENQGELGRMLVSWPQRHGEEEEAKVQNYIRKIGSAAGASEAAQKGEYVVAQAPDEERWAAQEASTRVYEQALSERDPVMSLFVDKVAQLVDGNPRQIKRYVNVFRFYSTLRHRLRLEGAIASEDLPSDKILAKFVALSIQWPQAVDCLRMKVYTADGRQVSLMVHLETESKKLTGDSVADDDAWKKIVGDGGLRMPAWAEERAFRKFWSSEDSLCAKERHGLW